MVGIVLVIGDIRALAADVFLALDIALIAPDLDNAVVRHSTSRPPF